MNPLRRRLEEWGRDSSPEPSADFVRDLDARLRMTGLRTGPRPPRRAWLPRALLAAATVTVLALVLARVATQPDVAPGSVQLASARDAVVELPDGSTVRATAGLVVPEGGLVRTGPDGRVVADGTAIGPNKSAVVRDGRLVARPAPTTKPADQRPEATPAPTLVPDVIAKPTERPADKPAATASPAPVKPAALRLACGAATEGDRKGIACRWSMSEHPSFATYRLWRAEGDRKAIIFRTADRQRTHYFDTAVRAGQKYAYKVEAVDSGGRVVGVSDPVNAAPPA